MCRNPSPPSTSSLFLWKKIDFRLRDRGDNCPIALQVGTRWSRQGGGGQPWDGVVTDRGYRGSGLLSRCHPLQSPLILAQKTECWGRGVGTTSYFSG